MKYSKLNVVLRTVALLCVAASLLSCLAGCTKKKPDPTVPSTTQRVPETTEQTQPTTAPAPTTQPTQPEQTTAPEETTEPNNCVHVLSNWKVEQPSSCTTEGSRYKECILCQSKVETEVIPITPHSPSNWTYVGKAASCTNQGSMKQECTQCTQLLFTIAVDKLDHDTLVVDGYAATATTPGKTDRVYCTICRRDVHKHYTIPATDTVNYTSQVTSFNTCTITGVTNFTGKELILPEKLGSYTVTAIGDGAFDGLNIETVYIPKTVTKIGSQAFSNCANLTNITYQGTTAQWSYLPKGTDWDGGTGEYTVYCFNQSIEKQQ